MNTSILIIHVEKDEAVPVEHSKSLFAWSSETNADTRLLIIPNATHTFNTKHPFDGTSNELEELIHSISGWINTKR